MNQLLDWAFAVPQTRWIYGFQGVLLAQLFAFTPVAFLVLIGVVEGVSPTLEEASQTLRADRWATFATVSLPLMRPGLANAFLVGFIESIADFGNPIVLGGDYGVLSTEIYFAVVGAQLDYGRAAALALLLLVFALGAFVLQRRVIGTRSYATISGKGDPGLPTPCPTARAARRNGSRCRGRPSPSCSTASPSSVASVKVWGRDYTPTLDHYIKAFAIERAPEGLIWSGAAWNSFWTTVTLAAIAAPLTAALGLIAAWLLVRQRFAGRAALEFATMLSFAVPGTVIGVAYVFAFNVPPFEITGTALIIVLCFVFRNMPVGVRAGMAAMSQIDRSLDEASATLRGRAPQTLVYVVLPLLRPAIVGALVYGFVRAVTTVERRGLSGHRRIRARHDLHHPSGHQRRLRSRHRLQLRSDRADAGGYPADPVRGRRPAPRPAHRPASWRPRVSVEFRNVVKRYGQADRRRRRELHRRPGHAGHPARPVGLRQDHDLAHDRRSRAAERRPHPDRRPTTSRRSVRTERDVSMVFQSYALFPHMNVLENVSYGLRRSGSREGRCPRAGARRPEPGRPRGYGERQPSELSGGQQQRVAVARALVLEPSVLLFDEPLSNLDARLRRQMREEIRELQQRLGLTVVYVTHDQQEAMAVSDRIIVMNAGRIEQQGTPRDLYERPADAASWPASWANPNPARGHVRSPRRGARARNAWAPHRSRLITPPRETARPPSRSVPKRLPSRRRRARRVRCRAHIREGKLPRHAYGIFDRDRGGHAVRDLPEGRATARGRRQGGARPGAARRDRRRGSRPPDG